MPSPVPPRYRAMNRKALAGQLSPRAAIKVKCYDCCGWERHDGGTDRIADCPVVHCPLWALRPFQNRAERLQGAVSATSSGQLALGDESGSGPA